MARIIWILAAALAIFIIVLIAWAPTGTTNRPIKDPAPTMAPTP